jgi:hypothetical protein
VLRGITQSPIISPCSFLEKPLWKQSSSKLLCNAQKSQKQKHQEQHFKTGEAAVNKSRVCQPTNSFLLSKKNPNVTAGTFYHCTSMRLAHTVMAILLISD